MVYRVIGTMSGSSLDGLDIAFVELQEVSGRWTYNLRHAACYEYSKEWIEKLSRATALDSLEYQLLDAEYGKICGAKRNSTAFIRTIRMTSEEHEAVVFRVWPGDKANLLQHRHR